MSTQKFAFTMAFFLMLAQSCPALPADGTSPPTNTAAVPRNEAYLYWELCVVDGKLRNVDKAFIPATVSNIVEFVRLRSVNNVVLAPGAGDILIQDLKLNSLEWEPVLEAMSVASGGAIEWTKRKSSPSAPASSEEQSEWSSELYIITPSMSRSKISSKQMEVFYLGGYMEHSGKGAVDSLQDVLGKTIQDLIPGLPKSHWSLQYHPGTSLLVASGGPDVLDAIRRVVLALPGTRSHPVEGRAGSDIGMRYGAGSDVYMPRAGAAPPPFAPTLPYGVGRLPGAAPDGQQPGYAPPPSHPAPKAR